MNFRPTLITFLLLLTSHALWGQQIDPDLHDFGSEEITQPAKRGPFSFESHIDYIGDADISHGFFEKDTISFAESDVEFGVIVYYCPEYEEGVRLALDFSATYLRWNQNPYFEQDHFNTLSLEAVYFTHRLKHWFWRTAFSINMDTDEWQADYTSYDLMLWGRYDYSDTIGIHIGFWAETGLRLDRVWPIIGADWKISEKWKLNLVYPVNISLNYMINPQWSLALAGRNFDVRFRVNRNESCPRFLVRYQNIGAEFMVRYENSGISANIHAGVAFAGRYRVANPGNHHAHTYNLNPSGYIGGEIDVSF